MPSNEIMELFGRMDPPFETFSRADLGPDFGEELDTVSRMWIACGYRPGVVAYLNFFLLRDFIEIHDRADPSRFQSFRSMAESFYRTDLFVRDVTDSGPNATGGISSRKIRALLRGIMGRHRAVDIPLWMMTHFGYRLLDNVEKQVEGFSERERQLHLHYMDKAFRIMGIPFSTDRSLLEEYARLIETAHRGPSPSLERHVRNILVIGEMVGVSSRSDVIGGMLPETTRDEFLAVYRRARPGALRRVASRAVGRFAMKRAVGQPREAVPVSD
jgi:hypothetical protein